MDRRRYSLMQVGLLFVAGTFANVGYINFVQHQADGRYSRLVQRQAAREQQIREERDRAAQQTRQQGLKIFCAWVYVQIDPALGPPTTVRGERILAANRTFYKQIGCKGAP